MIDPVMKGPARDIQLSDLGVLTPSVRLVLLATDGSEPALAGTQDAVLVARCFDARLHVLYVDTGFEETTLPEEPVSDERFAELEGPIRGLILARRLASVNGVECTVEVARGGVARNIIGAADREEASLIVLGDTGRTGLRRIALGSVAEAVIKASEIPVLVVKAL